MAISNVSLNPPASGSVSSIVGNAAVPAVDGAQTGASQPVSAVVTLSAQGLQLSQSQANQIQVDQNQASQSQSNQTPTLSTVDTATTPNVVPQSKETTATPGIQFMAGDSKGGRVNTFA